MATFSFGVTPGAPGTYINERVGNVASAGLASFSTTYMLVETEENVPVTRFPFNVPVPVSSLEDYRALVGGVPDSRIPGLSYNCVASFFSNAQVGDLRVVRVGTPNQIVEVEIFPSATKIGSSGIPSALQAGDTVYAQITLNGLKLVTGDGSTGYTADGEWLGVPVVIPVDYISGDPVNNRKISEAISTAIATAIETNPSVRSAIYVRDFGLVNDLNPSSNSENSYVTVAATTYDGPVSVVTLQNPVGAAYILMQNAYEVENIVGLSTNLERVPQDYIQCINTAFDGQTNQGYLITPTAYAQFDAKGRAAIGAAAAAHCQDNNFKWMALADAGPFLVTDINKFNNYVPHQPAADLVTGNQYLIDNAIYRWTGADVNYNRLKYQSLVPGYDPKVAVQQSKSNVAIDEKTGILDLAKYTATSESPYAEVGVFRLDTNVSWPVDYQIQEVTLSGLGADFLSLLPVGESSVNVYFVAPPYDTAQYGPYPSDGSDQYIFIAESAAEAVSVLTAVTALGGTSKVIDSGIAPVGAVTVAAPTGSTAEATYDVPEWNLPVEINGQTSNLIQNITGAPVSVNTLHLPGTLQNSTEDYRLSFVSRTLFDPSASLYESTASGFEGAMAISCVSHGLVNGQKLFFTQPVYSDSTTLLKATTKVAVRAYFVKVIDNNNFVVATSFANYLAGNYVPMPIGTTISSSPTIFYTAVSGGGTTAVNLSELTAVPFTRGRKYGFASGTIANQAASSTSFTNSANNPQVSIYMNTSSRILGNERILPYGEDTSADWLPKLSLVNPGSSSTTIENFLCTPTVDQSFASEAYLVPAVNAILGGDYNAGTDVIATLDVGSLVGGADYVDGSYFNVPLTGGTGSDAKANITVSGGAVTSVVLVTGGTGYTVGDTLSANDADLGDSGIGAGFAIDVDSLVGSDAGVIDTLNSLVSGSGYVNGTYNSVPLTGGSGSGAKANITVATGGVTLVTLVDGGSGYAAGDTLSANDSDLGNSGLGGGFSIDVNATFSEINEAAYNLSPYAVALGLTNPASTTNLQNAVSSLVGVYFNVTGPGSTPDGNATVTEGDRIAVVYTGSGYDWVVVPADSLGGDLSSVAQVCYGSQVELSFTPEETPPANLWRFDAITSTEIIDDALRGVGFAGEPQAEFVEAGVDNVNRLYEDSQRYFNAFGFIAFYGSHIENSAGQYIPPTPYVAGVALRRYRAEGFQFPPAGTKYQLADAVGVQIPVNSAQQNLLNPDGCNVVRSLPGYPSTAVFIWGGRTRINKAVADQRKFQFVNTRVIQNVVYGSLRSAFDNQIFSIIDGFGIVFNQIVSIGNSVMNQLYNAGALYGARPSDAFQVICDDRINTPENLENGIVYVKVFDVPVPALERIEIDLIRVSIGQMNKELASQGLTNI